MKITSLTIRRFRAIQNLDISFLDPLGEPRPVTIIAGPNGSGKTSILFAIVQALRGVVGYRTADVPEPTPDDIRSQGHTNGTWSESPAEAQVTLRLRYNLEERTTVPRVLKVLGKAPPPNLLNSELAIDWIYPPGFDADGKQLPWWSASVQPGVPAVRSWLQARAWAIGARRRRTSNVPPDDFDSLGGIVLFPQDRNLRNRVVGEPTLLASRKPEDLYAGEEDVDESMDKRGRELQRPELTVTEILHYLSDYAKNRETQLPDDANREKQIKNYFDQVCAPKKYLGYRYRGADDAIGAPVLEDGGRQYPLTHAASGEQVMLEYITRLIYRGVIRNSIILIDEPEVHLHPSWVRRLYMALPKIGSANQYIMTTHSPELRQRAAADNCLIDLGSLESSE